MARAVRNSALRGRISGRSVRRVLRAEWVFYAFLVLVYLALAALLLRVTRGEKDRIRLAAYSEAEHALFSAATALRNGVPGEEVAQGRLLGLGSYDARGQSAGALRLRPAGRGGGGGVALAHRVLPGRRQQDGDHPAAGGAAAAAAAGGGGREGGRALGAEPARPGAGCARRSAGFTRPGAGFTPPVSALPVRGAPGRGALAPGTPPGLQPGAVAVPVLRGDGLRLRSVPPQLARSQAPGGAEAAGAPGRGGSHPVARDQEPAGRHPPAGRRAGPLPAPRGGGGPARPSARRSTGCGSSPTASGIS